MQLYKSKDYNVLLNNMKFQHLNVQKHKNPQQFLHMNKISVVLADNSKTINNNQVENYLNHKIELCK